MREHGNQQVRNNNKKIGEAFDRNLELSKLVQEMDYRRIYAQQNRINNTGIAVGITALVIASFYIPPLANKAGAAIISLKELISDKDV